MGQSAAVKAPLLSQTLQRQHSRGVPAALSCFQLSSVYGSSSSTFVCNKEPVSSSFSRLFHSVSMSMFVQLNTFRFHNEYQLSRNNTEVHEMYCYVVECTSC